MRQIQLARHSVNNFFIVANNVKDVNLEKTKALAQFLELRGKRCEYTGIERVFEDENDVLKFAAKIKEDVEAIHYALYSGVKGIFIMHGKNIEDIKNNKQIYELIENREIQKVVFL